MEDFWKMPRERRLFYIASEVYENENPVRLDTLNIIAKGGGV